MSHPAEHRQSHREDILLVSRQIAECREEGVACVTQQHHKCRYKTESVKPVKMLFGFIHYINFLFLALAGSIELRTVVPPVLPEIHLLDVLLHPTEMHIQLVQVLQQGAEGRTLCHLGKGIDVLGEALATVTELAVGTGDVGVGVVDIT